MHHATGFRCEWFTNRTPVVGAPAAVLGPADILVLPEWYGPGLHGIPTGPRVIVFNQRAYDTFDHIPYSVDTPGAPYAGLPGLAALLAVSDDNVDLLRYAFPTIPVKLTRNVIDAEVFHAGGWPRPRRIAYVGHRRAAEREQLLHILGSRGVLRGWEVTQIAGRTEQQVAQILRDSAIFLSFSEREGFGLPPAEAMACAAYVVGYPGLAGREFFDPAYCSPATDGDLLAFARAVEDACSIYDREPALLAKRAAAASAAVLGRYSRDGLRDDLAAFYRELLPTAG
nr:glycosyltransferase [Micromonospora sp. DSM 115978]